MEWTLRQEQPGDYSEVEHLTREAFWDVYKPGCDEHLIAHRLRSSPLFVPRLDLVALEGDKIVGNIMYSRANVMDDSGGNTEVLVFGPLSVLPEYQGRGIGSLLVRRSMELAREMGFRGICIFGSPAYYRRFGFVPAARFHILPPDGNPMDAFQAVELAPGGLEGVTGWFAEDPVFTADPDEVEEFDRRFPPKEKHVTDTQL